MLSKIRCSSWPPTDFDALPTIAAGTDDRVSRGMDTITTRLPTI
jgi:hypothetical protein